MILDYDFYLTFNIYKVIHKPIKNSGSSSG